MGYDRSGIEYVMGGEMAAACAGATSPCGSWNVTSPAPPPRHRHPPHSGHGDPHATQDTTKSSSRSRATTLNAIATWTLTDGGGGAGPATLIDGKRPIDCAIDVGLRTEIVIYHVSGNVWLVVTCKHVRNTVSTQR